MKSSIINSINSLPPLPKTIVDINRVYADEDSGICELAKVIEPDPMIVANLLKAANSPLYAFGKKIRNVSQAISLFGMSMTRSIALSNSIRKLLNVDMQPYGVSSEKFAEISSLQATLMKKWYEKIDGRKSEELFLAAFLQETGKILIASDIIQDDEYTSFSSEIGVAFNIADVENSYVGVTSATVTAEIFSHWGFHQKFIDMIKYADNPSQASDDIHEYSMALHIVKTALPINAPLSEKAISHALKKAEDAGYEKEILENAIKDIIEKMEQN